ncbi:hypothetical protein IMG5_029931 [Ichthyophthirius multifiliis]|uniref:UvrD-like helicase C-terminal domain-containing protein n=1 Tax=Ichthyophthirius multifiliis TaxID=5932 RepID=G0QLF7_ICHMU|nr:hypothetical protein IMG5_029931 [Ichthyophthirius multifiliis]EGR33951.1 hypothetical protein IMG5_029931 [Ichthyophthirius multifiliis]|eukprot:XP_004039255.1 hypothetical protein IMG5_029931 [Ichthyophthirius multifiliis]
MENFNFNEEQKQIILEKKYQSMQILACAGSGKTTTILYRVQYLINQNNINPTNIIITAFNISAAKQIKKKLNNLLGEKIQKQIKINNIDKIVKNWLLFQNQLNVDQLYIKEYTSKIVFLLKNNIDFSEKVLNSFEYFFFDECQDCNNEEIQLIEFFLEKEKKIILVGDIAQSIYNFREDQKFLNNKKIFFENLEKYNVKIYNLSTNFSLKEQNDTLISLIQNLIQQQKLYNYKDIAILSRNNKSLLILEEYLEIYNNNSNAQKIPFKTDIRDQNNLKKNKKDEDNKKNNIILTTIHKSKGLEWKIIFLLNLSDQVFPGTNKSIILEDERKIFYTGITRAKEKLYLSYVQYKGNFICRFIQEINNQFYQKNFMIFQETNNKKEIDNLALKNKYRSIFLEDIIQLLNKQNFEQLRKIGCLNLKKEIIQIHLQCTLGDFLVENNLVNEFMIFLKCFICRYINESLLQENIQNVQGGFDNKFCKKVLFGEFFNEEEFEFESLNEKYIKEQYIRDIICKSYESFTDRKKKSLDILQDIYNVSICQSISNFRKRLLYKREVFIHFQYNKYILKQTIKYFLPFVFKQIQTNSQNKCKIFLNQIFFDENFYFQTDFLIICGHTFFEVYFKDNDILNFEEKILLLTKVSVLKNSQNIQIQEIYVYFPLQGTMHVFNIDSGNKMFNLILTILFNARQDQIEEQAEKEANEKIFNNYTDNQYKQEQKFNCFIYIVGHILNHLDKKVFGKIQNNKILIKIQRVNVIQINKQIQIAQIQQIMIIIHIILYKEINIQINNKKQIIVIIIKKIFLL